MLKKIIYISFIVSASFSTQIFADAQAQLDQAMNYINEKQFEQAGSIYDSLLANQPEKETEILALSGKVVIDILQGNTTTAKTSADALIANNSSNEIVSSAAFDIAHAYFSTGNPGGAKEYYQYIIDNWLNSGDAMPALFGVIMCNNSLGKVQEADTALNKLLSNLSTQEDILGPLLDTAEYYQSVGKYDSALNLYQLVVQNWPDSEVAIFAYRGVGFCQAAIGNNPEAINTLAVMLEKFKGHPDLGVEASAIAEPYYNEGFRLKTEGKSERARIFFLAALEIADIVKAQDSKGVETFDTYCWMGASYSGLEENQKALECYKNAVEKYPDNAMAWHALFKIGQIYERLKQTESINASECDLNIRQAYSKLLEKYPDCKAAKAAQNWLNRHHSE